MLSVALILWVLRVPVTTTLLGWLLLCFAPQAQDLFTEYLDVVMWLRMLLFVVVLTVFWALPTHYAARMLVNSDSRLPANGGPCLAGAALWLPRLLGLLTFVAVEAAILRSYMNIPTLDQQREVVRPVEQALLAMAGWVALGAVAYLLWIFFRPRDLRPRGLLGRINAKLGWFWQAISPGRKSGSADEEGRDFGRLILAAVFAIFAGIFFVGADHVAGWFPRSMAIPFILGGWLPFLTYLSGLGRQIRAPLITGLAVLVAIVAVVFGDNHTVRRVASKDVVPIKIEDAIDLWMTENGCNPKTSNNAPAASCPRPIIVAAAGGASRAGFMMASMIGYFLDTQEADYYGVKGLSSKDVRNRLFSISGVSGGAMGAVMVTAALGAASPAADKQPCVNAVAVDQWWGDKVNNWRDCLEALTSGDFLTAGFLGFAFNDALPFTLRDRAAVLEDSWRNRFGDVVPKAKEDAKTLGCGGLDCPFLSLRPQPGHWIPLLVLNGTSEAIGRRILTTPLAMSYAPPGKCPTAVTNGPCPLFVEADSFHQLLRTEIASESWREWLGMFGRLLYGNPQANDIRLSTAALNSARFPLISPPGSVRNQEYRLVDRIVDGGYFENYGTLTARELALAIHTIAPQLKPLVIVISNDPDDQLGPTDDVANDPQVPPRPTATAGEVLSEVSAPITTVFNLRTAHGVQAVDALRTGLHATIPECDKLVIQLRISRDGNKSLSMSWWESPLVQRRIHRQTESDPDTNYAREHNQNLPRLKAIWQEMQSSSCRAS
ncbi:hypothetical protein AXW67_03570 [Bradyrhizobium neotropicale]|uniref:PNPLA domain-containing protein n=1 Tax=Bradyrhizobium neotropicale TaxID=1497615 RepID=A0A176ZFI3_9BRAD|nr:hypothetical protein AXW67_03570 [Bradyrhizobium neotropicale]